MKKVYHKKMFLTCFFGVLFLINTGYSATYNQPWATWEASGNNMLESFSGTVGTIYSHDGYVIVHLNKESALVNYGYSGDVTVQSQTKLYSGFQISADDKVSLSLIIAAYTTGKKIKVFLSQTSLNNYNKVRIVQIHD